MTFGISGKNVDLLVYCLFFSVSDLPWGGVLSFADPNLSFLIHFLVPFTFLSHPFYLFIYLFIYISIYLFICLFPVLGFS